MLLVAPQEGSCSQEYHKAKCNAPVWKLGGQQCAATTQQAAFLLMYLRREGRMMNGSFERYASTAMLQLGIKQATELTPVI